MNTTTPSGRTAPVNGARGYSLLLTLMLLAMLAAAIAIMVNVLVSAQRTSGEMIQRRVNFYACDGMGRIVTKLAQDYLANEEAPTDAGLEAYICAEGGGTCPTLPKITPAGFNVVSFDVQLGTSTTAPIPSGPFQDMNAKQTDVALDLRAERSGTGFACETHQDVTLAQIGLFQFFVFAEEFVDVYNGPAMTINGRVHVNGDFCGSKWVSNLQIETLTASGTILVGSDCDRYQPASSNLYVKKKGTGSWVQMTAANDHSCTTCGGTPWADYALSTWGGNVQDSSHDVPNLKVPVSGTPPVQDGRDASGTTVDNSKTQRFIIDPVRFVDTVDAKEQKFAYKADIRIINGVWYKRDPTNPTVPGIPIWSDHPGHYTQDPAREEGLVGTENVGQKDIYADQAYTKIPRHYSYYEYDEANAQLLDDAQGVISYGTLFRKSATSWKPGYYLRTVSSGVGANNVVTNTGVGSERRQRFCGYTSGGGLYTKSASYQLVEVEAQDCFQCYASDAPPTGTTPCGTTKQLEKGAGYLEATRMGITDARVQYNNGSSNNSQSKILPVNFDMAAFATAMQDTTSGELGSHFGGGTSFNGIVYISYTWPGQLGAGTFGGSGAQPLSPMWPDPGAQNDLTQALHHTTNASVGSTYNTNYGDTHATRALPWPLCSGPDGANGLGYDPGAGKRVGFSGPPDTNGTTYFDPLFTIPNCDPTVSPTTRPNALRVHNAYTIPKALFPDGLTIATNLPAYLMSDTNKTSFDTPTEWVPFLITGDAVTLLSSAWKDEWLRWNVSSSLSPRVPANTHYQMAMLTGDVSTSNNRWSGGINNFPRFLEDWDGRTTTIYGSFVIGFRSVWHRYRWEYNPIYNAPNRNWSFDTNFNAVTNQPPGTPVYNVQAVKKWAAE